MDKKVILGQLGGLLFTQESLDFMQQSSETLHTLARALCTLEGHQCLIVSGCETQGANVSPGVVIIDGELLPFAGGAAKAYVQIEETREKGEFMDGQPKETYVSRRVVFSGSGTPWSTFRGLTEKLDKTAEAGGDLSGIFQNLLIKDGAITPAKLTADVKSVFYYTHILAANAANAANLIGMQHGNGEPLPGIVIIRNTTPNVGAMLEYGNYPVGTLVVIASNGDYTVIIPGGGYHSSLITPSGQPNLYIGVVVYPGQLIGKIIV